LPCLARLHGLRNVIPLNPVRNGDESPRIVSTNFHALALWVFKVLSLLLRSRCGGVGSWLRWDFLVSRL
jgi:hypothetical protein